MRRWWFLLLAAALVVAGVVVVATADVPLLYGYYVSTGESPDPGYESVLSLSVDEWRVGRQWALGLGLVVLGLVVLTAGAGYRLGRRRA